MISRDELRQLAEFECRTPNELAITFYFEPGTPKDKSHRAEAILAKDLVREALHQLHLHGRNREAQQDLARMLELAENLRGNGGRAKAIFACASRGLWREYDLPPVALPTKLFLNRRFHLKPLAPVFSENPLVWVAMIDQQTAKFYELRFEEMTELASLANPQPRRGRSDGYAGYDAGHAQRHTEDEIRRHFRQAADVLKGAAEKRQFEALVIGTHDVNWPEVEAQLHPEVRKRLLGRFSPGSGRMANERIRSEAERIVREALQKHHETVLRETLDEANANGRGVTGLRRVLRAMELREVEKLIMTSEYAARSVECTSCGHLDSHLVSYCPVCGRATRELEDVCEALVPTAIRNKLELILIPSHPSLDRVGNIAAMLRFRADRNTNHMRAAS